MGTLALSYLLLALSAVAAQAADICEAVALRYVAAIESPRSILTKGEADHTITMYVVDNQGDGSFCSHGGYCYPTHVYLEGQKVEALRLTNCRVDNAHPHTDGDETTYAVEVIRSKVSTARLREDDLENKFLSFGMCNACAGGATNLYLHRPKSRCAKLAKRALEGNPDAVRLMSDNPDYCTLTSGPHGETVWPN